MRHYQYWHHQVSLPPVTLLCEAALARIPSPPFPSTRLLQWITASNRTTLTAAHNHTFAGHKQYYTVLVVIFHSLQCVFPPSYICTHAFPFQRTPALHCTALH